MLKIFTKKGDGGTTSLADGERVAKCSELIELYGSLDELNSFIGWSAEALHSDSYQEAEFSSILKQLYQTQRQLFSLGQQLTAKKGISIEQDLAELEGAIDAISRKLPLLKSFILPGGGEAASRFHIARTVCRRTERAAFRAAAKNGNSIIVGNYLNRLSDWLFVVARFIAFVTNVEEVLVD